MCEIHRRVFCSGYVRNYAMLASMAESKDQRIIESWKKNVHPWVTAVRNGEIESRILVTDRAILAEVLRHRPKTVLDLGCGEGWLTRALASHGIDALGLDIVPALIDAASELGPGRYRTLAYEDLSAATLQEQFDTVVCNFSLLGKESVEQVFQQVPTLLNENGVFIVQTLHPLVACGDQPYRDGWRQGSWAGFSDQFSEPAPWYFRTLESWQALFVDNGFKQADVAEPLHPDTRQPSSIIFTGELRR